MSHCTETSKRSFCLKESLDRFGLEPKGIIHVGMSDSRLIDRYLNIGFKNALVLEADPACFEALVSQPAMDGVCIVHTAVAGFDGTVELNRTELVGCSSLLEFWKHREIYPHLEQTDRVEVPVRTLDRVLKELQIDPTLYNALVIDVQGSELMVLEGAADTLRHIEIICLDVYHEEIYRDVPLHEVIDAHLRGSGFNCAALRYPWCRTIGGAIYLRRSVLSMTSLGKNGRFANQLFQYLFLRLAAKVQGMCLQIPEWIGREIYDLDDPPVLAHLEQTIIDGSANVSCELDVFSNPERLITSGRFPLLNTNVWGYFQFNLRAYEPYRDFIRDLYRPKGSVGRQLSAAIERVRLFGKKIIGVHLRRGDYGYGIFFRAPCAWYEKWLKEMRFDPDQYLVYICSEDASRYAHRFPGYQVLTGEMLGVSWEMDSALFDFQMLCESDVLGISNSSFSFMASLLNERCSQFFRPCIKTGTLQSFQPWFSDPLIQIEVSPEEHEALIQID